MRLKTHLEKFYGLKFAVEDRGGIRQGVRAELRYPKSAVAAAAERCPIPIAARPETIRRSTSESSPFPIDLISALPVSLTDPVASSVLKARGLVSVLLPS